MSVDLYYKPLVTDIPALPRLELESALRAFCQAPEYYRLQYLQASYGVAFDGYSYPGQSDSLNQGEEDWLHSFVFSDFYPPERYPRELRSYVRQQWPGIKGVVSALEQQVLSELGLASICEQYMQNFAHMMSANYFPPVETTASSFDQRLHPESGRPGSNGVDGLRLSAHPDVSLLTVFITGIGEDFQYRDAAGNWVDAPATDTIAVFPGDLMQWLTDGGVPALEHRVKQGADRDERFSFALFSLPRPGATLISNAGNRISTEQWFRLHLSQWDY